MFCETSRKRHLSLVRSNEATPRQTLRMLRVSQGSGRNRGRTEMASTLSLGGRPGMAAFVEKPRKPRTESQKQMSMVDAQMRQVESGLEKLRACYWTPSPPCIVEHRNAWRCAQSSGASPLSIPVPSASVLPSCQAILVQANRDGKHIESGSLGSTLGRNPSFG